MMVRSTSVVSPDISSRTFLPVFVDNSRTRRGMRWNTEPTGCARMDMTLSFSSRVWWMTSSRICARRPLISSESPCTIWPSMACAMTSSPTMLTTRSILSRSTRVVVARFGRRCRSPPPASLRPLRRLSAADAPRPAARCRQRAGRLDAAGVSSDSTSDPLVHERRRPQRIVFDDLELAVADHELENVVDCRAAHRSVACRSSRYRAGRAQCRRAAAGARSGDEVELAELAQLAQNVERLVGVPEHLRPSAGT